MKVLKLVAVLLVMFVATPAFGESRDWYGGIVRFDDEDGAHCEIQVDECTLVVPEYSIFCHVRRMEPCDCDTCDAPDFKAPYPTAPIAADGCHDDGVVFDVSTACNNQPR